MNVLQPENCISSFVLAQLTTDRMKAKTAGDDRGPENERMLYSVPTLFL